MESLNVSTQLWGSPQVLELASSQLPSLTASTTDEPIEETPICCWNFCPRDTGKKIPRHQANSNS